MRFLGELDWGPELAILTASLSRWGSLSVGGNLVFAVSGVSTRVESDECDDSDTRFRDGGCSAIRGGEANLS